MFYQFSKFTFLNGSLESMRISCLSVASGSAEESLLLGFQCTDSKDIVFRQKEGKERSESSVFHSFGCKGLEISLKKKT